MISVIGARFSISELTGMEISPRPLAHASVKTPWVSTNCKFFATYTGKQSLFPHISVVLFLIYQCVMWKCVTCERREATRGGKKAETVSFSYNKFVPT